MDVVHRFLRVLSDFRARNIHVILVEVSRALLRKRVRGSTSYMQPGGALPPLARGDLERGCLCTSNNAHVPDIDLSTLGGGGNRTRVLRRLVKTSPGAACCSFLSPGSGAGTLPRAQSLLDFPAAPVTGSAG